MIDMMTLYKRNIGLIELLKNNLWINKQSSTITNLYLQKKKMVPILNNAKRLYNKS